MKKSIIAVCMAVLSTVIFAQNAASDFVIDSNGVITKYEGWATTVVIPETINGIRVTGIGREAFASNDLTRVTIPRSVVSIGEGAFRNNRLTSVAIPGDGVTIGNSAFSGNPITSITLGNNHIFRAGIVPNDRALSSLFYDYVCNDRKAGTYATNQAANSEKRADDFLYIDTRYGVFITGYRGSAANRLTIPPVLAGLPVKAISGFSGITRVQIPDSVTYIDDGAFQLPLNRLTSITIPNSVLYIGSEAFSNNELTSVTIGNNVLYIGSKAFAGNRLTSVTIPDSVSYIGGEAFSNNELTSVTIGANVNVHMGYTRLTYGDVNNEPRSDGIPYFYDAYNANNRTAGTYTRANANARTWTKSGTSSNTTQLSSNSTTPSTTSNSSNFFVEIAGSFIVNLSAMDNAGGAWNYIRNVSRVTGLRNKGDQDRNKFEEYDANVRITIPFPAGFNVDDYDYFTFNVVFMNGNTKVDPKWGDAQLHACSDMELNYGWDSIIATFWNLGMDDGDPYNATNATIKRSTAVFKGITPDGFILHRLEGTGFTHVVITEIKFFN